MKLTTEKAKELGKKSSRKGVPNKSTAEIRDAFKMLLEDNIEKLQEDLDSMKPEQRVKTILELSKFVIPTLKSTEIKTEINVHTLLKLTPQERQRRIIELQKEVK